MWLDLGPNVLNFAISVKFGILEGGGKIQKRRVYL